MYTGFVRQIKPGYGVVLLVQKFVFFVFRKAESWEMEARCEILLI